MATIEDLTKAIQEGDTIRVKEIQEELLGTSNYSKDKKYLQDIKGKTLYRTLTRIYTKDSSLTYMDYMKFISSMITHGIIESDKSGRSFNSLHLGELYSLLGEFLLSGNSNKGNDSVIEDCQTFVDKIYGSLIEDIESD